MGQAGADAARRCLLGGVRANNSAGSGSPARLSQGSAEKPKQRQDAASIGGADRLQACVAGMRKLAFLARFGDYNSLLSQFGLTKQLCPRHEGSGFGDYTLSLITFASASSPTFIEKSHILQGA